MAPAKHIIAVDLEKLAPDALSAVKAAQVPIPPPAARKKGLTIRVPEEKLARWKAENRQRQESMTRRIERLLDADSFVI